MKINKNDPQLTAYVLNELTAQEMKAIEAQIQNDPELKLEVARLKSNITQLKNLKAQESFRLDPHQRENIFKAAGIQQTSMWSKILKYSGGLVAASLAVVIYTNNSTGLKKAASSKASDMAAAEAPALSEVSEAPSTKVIARAESRPANAKKMMKLEEESQDAAAMVQSRGAPPPGEFDAAADGAQLAPIANAPAAPAPASPPAKADFAESKVAHSSKDLAKDMPKNVFSAGEVGSAGMSQNKMRLLEPSQAQKKESAVSDEVASSAPATLAESEGRGSSGGGSALGSSSKGAVSASISAKPTVSKQLYDIEFKSSHMEIYAKISDPVFKCLDSSISQYVKYDVAWNLTWTAKLGNVTSFSSEIIDNGTESLKNPRQDFSAEINCVEQVIRSAFKSGLPPSQNENTFKYRLILKSN